MAVLPYGATITVFNAKEAYSHLKGSTHCSLLDCSAELGEVAYDLQVPGQERDGVHYWGYSSHFCSEAHALQWLEADYPQRQYSTSTLIDGIPTQETRDVWIHAFRKTGEYPEDTDRSGKWLIWLRAENIDRYWREICAAVEQGRLGGEAKVSTAASSYVKHGKPYVICVYTYDHADREDVMRIRQVLRDLGIRREIPYKADEDTHRLRYGSDYTPIYRA
jgi:Domain of unknown function (DUF1917)